MCYSKRMDNGARTFLGKLGVWASGDALDRTQLLEFARKLERWGYGTLWSPEAVGRDPFAVISYLAAQTERLAYATGIANIYARDAVTMKAVHHSLSELFPQRFVLGLGVSHEHLVSKLRGHEYKKPVPAMREYLEALDKALYLGKAPAELAPIVLAALRRPMLELAAQKARGAHPYLVPPEHTRRARAILGPAAWLCPEQMVLHETDAAKARAVGRAVLKVYTRLPNYQRNLRDFGFEDADFVDGGSDRLVDALIAWGEPDRIREHVEAHFSAGADHVCIQALRADGRPGPDLDLLEALAPEA
ncbi:MAG TPA: TIGR03620 family F420-dependent LLM class oxidoreductase [Polyangiales bacterium]|nr:TIGR03620 family F420-dependent LLM class oxidoreductase [Polyangiales bacterium]